MTINIDSNIRDVQKAFNQKVSQFRHEIKDQMQAAGLKFKEHIVKQQMSGRPGIKYHSGRMARSWRIKTTDNGDSFSTHIENYAPYTMYHQTGLPSRHIPKRLHVFEEFKIAGEAIFKKELENAAKKLEK